jgi:hypothetical protein
MEDFGARDFDSDEFCQKVVSECDVLLGLVGPTYGSTPPDSELSYSEREWVQAGRSRLSRLMLMTDDNFPVESSYRESDEKAAKQLAFRRQVDRMRLRAKFSTPDEAATEAVKALHNDYARPTPLEEVERLESGDRTILSFPFVSNQAGFDTGLMIANMSGPPFGKGLAGPVVVAYSGASTAFGEIREAQASSILAPGESLIFTLSGGNTRQGIPGAPEFQGYVLALCNFPRARGFAFMTDGFGGIPQIASGYLAEVVNPDDVLAYREWAEELGFST